MATTTSMRRLPMHTQAMLPAVEAMRPLSAIASAPRRSGLPGSHHLQFRQLGREHALRSDPPPIKVLNPIASHLDVMRTTLLGGLLDTLRTNVNRKAERVRIFESGRCFLREGERFVQPPRIAGLAFGPADPPQWDSGKRTATSLTSKAISRRWPAPLHVTTVAAAASCTPSRAFRARSGRGTSDRMVGRIASAADARVRVAARPDRVRTRQRSPLTATDARRAGHLQAAGRSTRPGGRRRRGPACPEMSWPRLRR